MNDNLFLYNPKTYTIAAIIIGYILIEELSIDDQNAVGNWLMTVGQILDGNAAIAQAIQNKQNQNDNNTSNNNDDVILNCIKEDKKTINELKNMIKKIEERLDELSR